MTLPAYAKQLFGSLMKKYRWVEHDGKIGFPDIVNYVYEPEDMSLTEVACDPTPPTVRSHDRISYKYTLSISNMAAYDEIAATGFWYHPVHMGKTAIIDRFGEKPTPGQLKKMKEQAKQRVKKS